MKMGKLFDNTTRPDPDNETRAFPQMSPGEVEDPGVCFKQNQNVGRVVPLQNGQKEVPVGRRNRREYPRLSDIARAVGERDRAVVPYAPHSDAHHSWCDAPKCLGPCNCGFVGQTREEYIASNPEVETPLVPNPEDIDRQQALIKQQRALIFKMRQVLWSVIQWNDEYKHLNNLNGDPSWVQTAYDVFMESRPK